MAGVGHQRIDRPFADQLAQLVDALGGGKIDLQVIDLGAHAPEGRGGLDDLGPIGGDHEVVAVFDRQLCELIADAGGRASDDGERLQIFGHHGFLLPAGSRRISKLAMASKPLGSSPGSRLQGRGPQRFPMSRSGRRHARRSADIGSRLRK